MNFTTKLIISLISISATVIGSLWGAFEVSASAQGANIVCHGVQ